MPPEPELPASPGDMADWMFADVFPQIQGRWCREDENVYGTKSLNEVILNSTVDIRVITADPARTIVAEQAEVENRNFARPHYQFMLNYDVDGRAPDYFVFDESSGNLIHETWGSYVNVFVRIGEDETCSPDMSYSHGY